MPQPHLREADADRAAVASRLGEHMSAGRLTLEEFEDRLTRAYAAKTFGELDELTADLPAVDDEQPHRPARQDISAAAPATAFGTGPWEPETDVRSSWRAWVTTAMIVITIWAATSLASWELSYFWPVWVIGPWGAVLLARTVMDGRRQLPHRREPHPRDPHRHRGC